MDDKQLWRVCSKTMEVTRDTNMRELCHAVLDLLARYRTQKKPVVSTADTPVVSTPECPVCARRRTAKRDTMRRYRASA